MKDPALVMAAIAVALTSVSISQAAELLSPGDFIIAIDIDPPDSLSSYPANESPANAGDGNSATKYLNFGKENTGLFVTLFQAGPQAVQSMVLTTANDAPERDPASWKLFGTNDTVTSADNSTASDENWTLIAEGDANLPETRQTAAPAYSFSNPTSYASYRVLFPTIKNAGIADSMQIAEIGLFTSTDGTGTSVWDDFDFPGAFQLPQPTSQSPADQGVANLLDGTGPLGGSMSSSPPAEGPANAIDGTLNKYLNFGGSETGFIVTPSGGASTVRSFRLTTANDFNGRDPASYELYGTNEPIASQNDSFGIDEEWTLISSGDLTLPTARDTLGPVVPVGNNDAYDSYKLLFPELRVPDDPIMQIAEAQFFSTSNGTGTDILTDSSAVIGIDATVTLGTETKYLNFGKENTGFIVTPGAGDTVVDGFQMTTADDEPSRDPASWELYGTNDLITSQDDSRGDEETWVLIDSGDFNDDQVATDRQTTGDVVPVSNTTRYESYRIVFPTLRDGGAANSMQLAGFQLLGTVVGLPGDFNGDGVVDAADYTVYRDNVGATEDGAVLAGNGNGGIVDDADFALWVTNFGQSLASSSEAVPEPSTVLLAASLALPALARRQRP